MTSNIVRSKTPVWAKVLLFTFLILVVGGIAAGGGVALGMFFGATQEREVQVIRSIELEEQVVLVRSGVTGLKPESEVSDIKGFVIPWSDRSLLLRYEFDTMVGIEGSGVSIVPTGETSFLVTIPDFILIGTDDPRFSVVNEKNGVLSFATPEIDELQLAQELLTDDVLDGHIEGLRPVLEEQARTFYTNIVSAIDPGVTLEFKFAQ
ncbi:hypothetical protein [Marisediminicola antarctica]|uniref:DUF4230 domain-containing protein n=1 Tax=Marisediminicola antarctica TaxID=674079 RepID=A0A7L5AID0_9MICO|nr:hypothetical protein [Marisediminicola antarctica]QHO70328.1 hypothetical protein BHD05_12400 [Marisediminicola antarctica]